MTKPKELTQKQKYKIFYKMLKDYEREWKDYARNEAKIYWGMFS